MCRGGDGGEECDRGWGGGEECVRGWGGGRNQECVREGVCVGGGRGDECGRGWGGGCVGDKMRDVSGRWGGG